MPTKKRIAIIGAGPAGLTAAYILGKANQEVVVFEADPQFLGGISRTEKYKGYLFDIGGHRFFSKSKEVEEFWEEILGDNMLQRPRSSRIYYNKTFFSYPLVAMEALKKLGIINSVLCVLSYLNAKLFPVKNPLSFEDWVSNQFGKRLFNIFFKTYTEKVWGIPCDEISSEWASQRIKGLSLSSAIKNAFFSSKNKNGNGVIKTLIDSFRYPRKGPGMMWEACADKCLTLGVSILKNARVDKLYTEDSKWIIQLKDARQFVGFDYVISSAPLKELVPYLYPRPSSQVLHVAGELRYRDFITVVLILKDRHIFSDNWIYIHDSSVKVGRIQNFKSWSPEMVPDPTMVCYGMEYFCFEGDGLWSQPNESLIVLAKGELSQIGIASAEEILDGYVVRQKKAYPVYDQEYKTHIEMIKAGLDNYEGLCLVGRNGMHKYNNQDHSMMTAMLAARNILAGKKLYDLWLVNEDAEYHETIEELNIKKVGRMTPEKLKLA